MYGKLLEKIEMKCAKGNTDEYKPGIEAGKSDNDVYRLLQHMIKAVMGAMGKFLV